MNIHMAGRSPAPAANESPAGEPPEKNDTLRTTLSLRRRRGGRRVPPTTVNPPHTTYTLPFPLPLPNTRATPREVRENPRFPLCAPPPPKPKKRK